MSKWKDWLSEKREQGKKLKKDQLLILILSGILLLVIALPVGKPKSGNQESGQKNFLEDIFSGEKDSVLKDGDGLVAGVKDETEEIEDFGGDYTEDMENKLKQILSSMDQVGKAEVLITLKTSEEKIVEKDHPVTRSNTDEADSEGGRRAVNNLDSGETTVYETDSGKSTPYVIRTASPQIEGVVVVCEGAGTGSVSHNITEAIQALFGIEAHKIKVVKMKETDR